ncbi:MAG: hypothetical protein ACE5JB_06640 [bacterium]
MKNEVKFCEFYIKIVLSIFLWLVLAFGFTASLFAQGGAAGAFLRMGIGARAKAMGDAYTALAKGIEASYYNPAGLPLLENKELITSFRFLSLDRQFTYLGFGVPIHPKVDKSGNKTIDGGFALSWIHAGVGDIDGRDSDGRPVGDLSNSENAFIFSFALKPAKVFSLGLSVKVLWNRFPDVGINSETVSATGVGFDFGALFSPNQWVTFGIAVKDLNSKYTWNTDKIYGEDGSQTINKFPKVVRTGVAFVVPKIPELTLAFDYEDSKELNSRIHLGAEGVYKEVIVLRGGFDDGALTAGGGYHFDLFGKMAQLNYAFTSAGNRPDEEHIFTWVLQF